MPNENQRKLAGVAQSQTEPTINQPLHSVLQHIEAKDPVITKTMGDIEKEGLEKYIIKNQETKSSNHQNELDAPENAQAISSAVISTNEIKVKPPKRKKSSLLPLPQHQEKPSKKRRKL